MKLFANMCVDLYISMIMRVECMYVVFLLRKDYTTSHLCLNVVSSVFSSVCVILSSEDLNLMCGLSRPNKYQ